MTIGITPENAVQFARIDGYKKALACGFAARSFCTAWAGEALVAYNHGVAAGAAEWLKTEPDINYEMEDALS